ncbi:MAG: glycosyl hydrolase 115 family protein [Spirochaetales bacterium]|nr:glycosyl hydrolase 115 family protein [Spirochaetales bacterium]
MISNSDKHVDSDTYVSTESQPGGFCLVANEKAAPLVVSDLDYPGVIRAVGDLQMDIDRITHVMPLVSGGTVPGEKHLVLIGTIGKSPVIDSLITSNKLNVDNIVGKWETFLLQVVESPLPGVQQALVIAGSDQRGTIFGIYDLSAHIGVSPWYFWADVPPQEKKAIYILPGCHTQGEPAVKYRGFFINDEEPALGSWAYQFFGPSPNPDFPRGFHKEMYAKVFELLLRLKANYLLPAVWNRAFAEDDPGNHAMAKYYGIVIGTSHEAPMMRGIEEWNRHVVPAQRDSAGNIIVPGHDPYGGTGEWLFSKNPEAIKAYWREGIQRMVDEDFEGTIALGMRGPGDLSLPVGDGIELIENIIAVQREIITEVTGKDITTIPQVWTLYKEIQKYWDAGIRVPDDVTVIWCDDNWGNMQKLPDQNEPERAGGHGIYYHFDYVGGGRNYKWIDSSLIPNIWEQLHLTYNYGVNRLWVVNVGDMKSNELPIRFFFDYAWNPDKWPVEKLGTWEKKWAEQQFGEKYAVRIADILHTYASLQSNRKPELLNRNITLNPEYDIRVNPEAAVVNNDGCPFSLIDYAEMERVTAQWQNLAEEAERIKSTIPDSLQAAYFELVYYEVKASALLYEIRLYGFKNLLYLSQRRAAANDMADRAESAFIKTKELNYFYNNTLADGKWNGFQTQPYLAYGGPYPNSSWQQPETEGVADPDYIWPFLERINLPEGAVMGVAIDGSEKVWPGEATAPVLPVFSPFQTQSTQYIEVFNKGKDEFSFRIQAGVEWISISPDSGIVDKEVRAFVKVDWSSAPKGVTEVPITVTGPRGTCVIVQAKIHNPEFELQGKEKFIESNGYVSMEAAHYTGIRNTKKIRWKLIPDIGRTGHGMTPFPVTAPRQVPGEDSPCLEYRMHLFTKGPVTVWAYLSPRNNVLHTDGLKYAVSIDDKEPQIINITTALNCIPMNKSWERNTSDNVNRTSSIHIIDKPGEHILKFWMVDPTIVVQKLIVDTGGLKPSYLGPEESFRSDT